MNGKIVYAREITKNRGREEMIVIARVEGEGQKKR